MLALPIEVYQPMPELAQRRKIEEFLAAVRQLAHDTKRLAKMLVELREDDPFVIDKITTIDNSIPAIALERLLLVGEGRLATFLIDHAATVGETALAKCPIGLQEKFPDQTVPVIFRNADGQIDQRFKHIRDLTPKEVKLMFSLGNDGMNRIRSHSEATLALIASEEREKKEREKTRAKTKLPWQIVTSTSKPHGKSKSKTGSDIRNVQYRRDHIQTEEEYHRIGRQLDWKRLLTEAEWRAMGKKNGWL